MSTDSALYISMRLFDLAEEHDTTLIGTNNRDLHYPERYSSRSTQISDDSYDTAAYSWLPIWLTIW